MKAEPFKGKDVKAPQGGYQIERTTILYDAVIYRVESYYAFLITLTLIFYCDYVFGAYCYGLLAISLVTVEEEDPLAYDESEFDQESEMFEVLFGESGKTFKFKDEDGEVEQIILTEEQEANKILDKDHDIYNAYIKYQGALDRMECLEYKIFCELVLERIYRTKVGDDTDIDYNVEHDDTDDLEDEKLGLIESRKQFDEMNLNVHEKVRSYGLIPYDFFFELEEWETPSQFELQMIYDAHFYSEALKLRAAHSGSADLNEEISPYIINLNFINPEANFQKGNDYMFYWNIVHERLRYRELFTTQDLEAARDYKNFRAREKITELKIHKWVTNHYIHQTLISLGAYNAHPIDEYWLYFCISQNLEFYFDYRFSFFFSDLCKFEIWTEKINTTNINIINGWFYPDE